MSDNTLVLLVTGVVVAVCGKEEKDGEFFVQEVLEPGLPPQIPLPSAVSFGKEICFFWGLGVHDLAAATFEYLCEFL
jgi:DNA polymerase delta subunit 2